MSSMLSLFSIASAAAIILGPSFCFAQTDAGAGTATPAPDIKVSGPFTHDNLSIYFIHGPSADGPIPLTLSEALARKLFAVYETGNVNELAFENLGDEPVFLQSGDIVKGGRQDRVLTVSVVVPPKSGRMPIAAYCVEQHRWSARGQENAARFESSEKAMPSKSAKLAMAAAPRPGQRMGGNQAAVWDSVAETQGKLSANLGAPVAAAASASSLQLSLENEKLKGVKAAYIEALSGPDKDGGDVIGFAFAVGSRINSADVYPSHGLFAKMWGKLIDAAATEAISEGSRGAASVPPAASSVQAFLAGTAAAKAEAYAVDANTTRVLHQNSAGVFSETQQKDGHVLHRSYVAY